MLASCRSSASRRNQNLAHVSYKSGKKSMRLVIVESPYAGDTAKNVEYARECMLDALERGEAPFASHLLYTQCLDDSVPEERAIGIAAGLAWYSRADLSAVYLDLGLSQGMHLGIIRAEEVGRPVERRTLRKECGNANCLTYAIIVSNKTAYSLNWARYGSIWYCPICTNKT